MPLGSLGRFGIAVRVQPEAAAPLDVAAEPEAFQGGEIVRRRRSGGERRVLAGRDEPPVMSAFEGEDAVGEEARGLRPLAKPLGQRAKILADDRAAVPLAFECDESEQRVERIVDVGEVVPVSCIARRTICIHIAGHACQGEGSHNIGDGKTTTFFWMGSSQRSVVV